MSTWKPGDDFTKGRRLMGDGHKMACWVGGWFWPEFAAFTGSEMAIGNTVTLLVNALGKRFMNEDRATFEGGTLIAYQPKAEAWAIFDDNWRSTLPYQSIGHRNLEDRPFPPLPEYMYGGAVEVRGSELLDQIEAKFHEIVDNPEGVGRCVLRSNKNFAASSLDKLADFIGYDAEQKATFLATVERYNELCRKGYDEDFAVHSAKLFEIKTPPFYASQLSAGSLALSSLHSVVGIATDEYCQVIDMDHNVIPGLWAVGDIQGGRWSGGDSNVVSCLQNCFAQAAGRIAGQMVVKS
jgi:fumarate reductase flavoprotein subunit